MAQPCMSLLRRAPARKAVGMHLGHVTEEELAWTVEPAGVFAALGSEGMSSKRRPKRHDELHVWPLSPGLIRDDALLDSGSLRCSCRGYLACSSFQQLLATIAGLVRSREGDVAHAEMPVQRNGWQGGVCEDIIDCLQHCSTQQPCRQRREKACEELCEELWRIMVPTRRAR